MSESEEFTDKIGQKETFRTGIETIDDVNEATKRFNSILKEMREGNEEATLQVAVVEVEG